MKATQNMWGTRILTLGRGNERRYLVLWENVHDFSFFSYKIFSRGKPGQSIFVLEGEMTVIPRSARADTAQTLRGGTRIKVQGAKSDDTLKFQPSKTFAEENLSKPIDVVVKFRGSLGQGVYRVQPGSIITKKGLTPTDFCLFYHNWDIGQP